MTVMSYDLTLLAPNGAKMFSFPAVLSAYGSFAAGQIFIFNHRQYVIAKVGYEVVGNPQNSTVRTVLVLGEAKADDNPVPWPW